MGSSRQGIGFQGNALLCALSVTSLPAGCRVVGMVSWSSSVRPEQTLEWPEERVPSVLGTICCAGSIDDPAGVLLDAVDPGLSLGGKPADPDALCWVSAEHCPHQMLQGLRTPVRVCALRCGAY